MTAPATDHLSNRSRTLRAIGRARAACALLGGALVLSGATGGVVPTFGAHAQAQEVARDSAPLQGLNVGDEDLPFDAAGRPIVEGVPGVLPARQIPQAARDDLLPLEEERDRVLDAARAVRGGTAIPPLPGDVNAPAAVDSGGTDPDRLSPSAQPALPTF
jgi:hypothetical protein